MQAQIVQIGNSLGLRLPKAVLDSLSLKKAAMLSIQMRGDSIVLRPVKAPRSGWTDAFASAEVVDKNLWGDVPAAEGWNE